MTNVVNLRPPAENTTTTVDDFAPTMLRLQQEAPLPLPRHVLQGWFELMDLSKPLIAQVHGWCLAGGTELASACDLVYVAEDAQIGYPPVRSMSAWKVSK